MNRRGGVRWQLWAAGFAAFCMGAGAVAGCDSDDTSGQTTATTTTGTTTGTGTSTGTTTGSTPTTSSSSDPGCGGAAACQQLCDDAQAKIAACNADAGLGQGGGGGAGGGDPFLCDEEGQCVSNCVMQYSCHDIVFNDDNYATCYGCCKDPYTC